MLAALRRKSAETLRAYRSVLRNRELRRVELAWAALTLAGLMQAVAIAVFAFRTGGAAAVGLAAAVRVVPAAVTAPLAGAAADRYPRERVVLWGCLVATGAAALATLCVAADAPAGLVYGLGALVSACDSAVRPSQAALLPSLSATPEELTASNALSTTVESAGIFVGPAIGALVLGLAGIEVTLAATVVLFAASAFLTARVQSPSGAVAVPTSETGGGTESFLRSALGGLSLLARDREARLLVAVFSSQTLANGALNVFLVVVAVDLGLGAEGLGVLISAIGIGGLVGALSAAALGPATGLATGFSLGILLWGMPLLLIGLWTATAPTLAFLAALGLGNTLADVAGLTLLQRAVPDEVLARVLGVLESVIVATIGLGALLAPPLLDALGTQQALLVTGGMLVAVALLTWRPVAAIELRIGAPGPELELLRAAPIFAPLDPTTLERLASLLHPARLTAGETLFAQGARGDRVFVVAGGELEVYVDGRPVRRQRAGDVLGEIALLRDVPRTATVVAIEDSQLYALEREPFVAAVTAHPGSAAAARGLAASRLAHARPGLASVS